MSDYRIGDSVSEHLRQTMDVLRREVEDRKRSQSSLIAMTCNLRALIEDIQGKPIPDRLLRRNRDDEATR